MPKAYVIESDLVGVRPWLIGKIQFFLMMVLPLGSIPVVHAVSENYSRAVGTSLPYSLLWKLESLKLSLNNLWDDSYFLLHGIPVIVLNIIFIFEMVRYYKALVSRKHVILVGALSFLIPFIIAMASTIVFPIIGAYMGPMPFLLITGLIMLYRISGPEIEPFELLSDYTEV